jgi:hypothetical protein
MNVLKGLGTAICSFLLFLSLTIFGIALTVNSTLLNPDFVSGQIEKLDVSDLAREFAEEELEDEIPEDMEFLVDVIYNVIDEQEPWLKEQADYAIHAGYDFMLGETDALNIYIPLEDKKEDLRESLWNAFIDQMPEWLPELVESELGSYLDTYINDFAVDIPDQYLPDYVVDASTDILSEYLSNYLQDIAVEVTQNYQPQVTVLLQTVVRPYFDEYFDEIMEELPSEVSFTRNDIDDDTWEELLQVREYIGYFKTGYYCLIAFMVLLVILIFLINRNVRDSTRSLGISLLIYGVLEFAGIYVARNYLPTDLSSIFPSDFGIPESLQTWLSGFYVDLLAPLQTLSIIVIVVGVASILVSIFYKRRSGEQPVIADPDEE